MNRMLYQLSYAAVLCAHLMGKSYYTDEGKFCQQFFSKKQKKFLTHNLVGQDPQKGAVFGTFLRMSFVSVQKALYIQDQLIHLFFGGCPAGAETDSGMILVHMLPHTVGIVFVKFFQNILM